MAVRVLIVDDSPDFRKVLKHLLQKEEDVTLVGEAQDGEEAFVLAEQLRPQVILMDIDMPRLNGLEATRQIKSRRPEAKIVIVGIHDEEAYRRAALECGANGFVLKKSLLRELPSAIAAAAEPLDDAKLWEGPGA